MANNSNRDEFTAATKRLLEKQAGHHCSNPFCYKITSGASSDGQTTINIGEASHISAAAPGGPRYKTSLTSDERKSLGNGIWLCKYCAKVVDSKDPYFTEDLLIDWKQQTNKASWRSVVEKAPFPPLPSSPAVDDLRAKLKNAATADLAVFRRMESWPISKVPLKLKIYQIDEPLSTDALARAVTTFEDIIIVAAPGMGKTTSIFQIADGVANANAGVPIIVPLGEWATLQDSLLVSVLKRAAFKGISESDFQRAAGGHGVVLLLDGWNELGRGAQERARVEITRLKAELPELGLVISTRRQALDIPFVGTRADLLPLGDQQQMAIAREIRGDVGERLVDQAWLTPGVRELVSIPLYLTSLLALPDGQPFPATKEEVLRRFVSILEQDASKRTALLDATGGFHASFLDKLAVTMTGGANTSISDVEARKVINRVSRHLVETDQLAFVKTQPDELIDALVSVHALVRSDGTAGLSFQHQQFQEWFASHEVERLMVNAVNDPNYMEELRAKVLDKRPWAEPILFAVERTARGDHVQKRACATAILAGFDVDPLLAAEMIFRANDEIWCVIADEIQSRAKRWHTSGKLDRAFRFMVSTGRAEFIDHIWPLLTHENDQVHLGALRAAERFRISVLGKDAAELLATLPSPVRKHVLSEIASNSGMDGLDLATAVAKIDPDPDVKVAVANSLSFRRADRHLSELLRDSEDTVYNLLARRLFIEEVGDVEIQRRLASALERKKASGVSPREHLRILIWAEPSDDVSSEIVRLVTELDLDNREDNDRHLVWELNEHHPDAVAEAFFNRLQTGKELFYGADDILAATGWMLEDDELLRVALSEIERHDDKAEAAASILGPEAVGAIVDSYLEVRTRLRDPNGGFVQEASDRFYALQQRLAHTQGRSLVNAVLARSDTVKNGDIASLSDLFLRQDATESGRGRPFDADALETIGKLAQDWAARLLADDCASRHDKADVARMIGRAQTVELLPALQQLLDDNLKRYNEFRDAANASKWRDRAAVHEAQHPHMHEYQSALINLPAPETFKMLAKYLTNEHFGENAARVLAVQWTNRNEPRKDRWLPSGVDFSNVSTRRAGRRANPGESCAEADAIFDAVETLLADGTTEEQKKRAVVIGTVGSRLPHGDRAQIFENLIALAPQQSRAALMQGIVLSGEEVSINLIADGIEETLEEAKINTWILTQSDGYQLRDWLRLLPFARPITQIPEIVSRLPDAQRTPRMLEDVISNLADTALDDGQKVLIKLAENDPSLFQHHGWRKSIMSFEGEAAARRIVDLVLSGQLNESGNHFRLTDEIAGLLRSNPRTHAYVLDQLQEGPETAEQALLARSIAENPTQEDVALLVKYEIAKKQPFLNGRSVEAAVTVNISSETWGGAYEVIPVESTQLRNELLALTSDGGIHDPAARCLTEIDKIRDRHGAPESEPRHPDLSSGLPWPILISDPDAEDSE